MKVGREGRRTGGDVEYRQGVVLYRVGFPRETSLLWYK